MDQEEQNVQETSQEQTSEQQEKMFTQSEVDRIVTDRVKRSKDKLRSELFEEVQLLTPSACFGQKKKTSHMEMP